MLIFFFINFTKLNPSNNYVMSQVLQGVPFYVQCNLAISCDSGALLILAGASSGQREGKYSHKYEKTNAAAYIGNLKNHDHSKHKMCKFDFMIVQVITLK
ncbi:unnamed protein product [Amoebophrya sp. A25]|nr:unnamed protein product [Amoebophrya sp. A25]|eukprot:GSA25T00005371001.1